MARVAFPRCGSAYVVGVTGSPGVGKSTLVNRLLGHLRGMGERVAVVAVDPTSPLSGGAVLGDRVRMQEHATDPGVFIRSMGSRGQAGGLARATLGAVRVLDAAGWPIVIIETVGAGQVETDVAQAADTTVVVVSPGGGDSVQAAKAGLLEVADVVVVNQADREGADQAARDLRSELGGDIPLVKTVATAGVGTAELWEAVSHHRAVTAGPARAARRHARLEAEIRRLVRDRAAAAALDRCRGPEFEAAVAEVAARRLDPLSAADRFR